MNLTNITNTHLIFTKPNRNGSYSFRHNLNLVGETVTLSEDKTVIKHGGEDIAVTEQLINGILNPPVPEVIPPTEQEIFESAKSNALSTLKNNRDIKLRGGFEYNNKHYQTRNDSDISNITNVGIAAALSNLAGQPFSTVFIATDNTATIMDGVVAQGFWQTMVGAGEAVWQDYATRRQLLLNAADITELQEINLTFDV